ncbi:MAG TPA: serine/threonine-protein kinase [Chthoniobacteraceae bacterium]|nr:serine/threonine-protein kinase [Chthoniobacteraceae bacterium]
MRYVIQDPLGQGGSGAVFRALDQQLSREVAVKRIREDADIEGSIRKEAGILAALNHPNIVSIYDIAADEQGPFVVMELVEGRTLDDIVTEQPLNIRTFYELVDQVCKGLGAAHSRGLVHHDIKPKNIMLHFHADNTFTVKILDFGLARMEMEMEEANDDGTVAGTPNTISPEQLLRQPSDVRSDIYSLGCVFYFALTGRYPHDADEIQQIVQNHLNGNVVPLHRINPEITEPISRAISKMIAVDPNARPQSAQEVRNALWAAAKAPAAKGPVKVGGTTTRNIRTISTRVPQGKAPAAPAAITPPIHRSMEAAEVFDKIEAAPEYAPQKKRRNLTWLWTSLVILSLGALAYEVYHLRQHPKVTVVGPGANIQTYNVTDTATIKQHLGEEVILDGTPTGVTESPLFHGHYVKFSDDPDQIKLFISYDNASGEQLKQFIGKHIHAEGHIDNSANSLKLRVDAVTDITVQQQ